MIRDLVGALGALTLFAAMPAIAQIVDPDAATGVALGSQAKAATASLAREASLQGASLLKWRACRGKLRTGAITVCREAHVGDSKTYAAGAGTGSIYVNGAFPLSRPSRIAALLAQSGLAVRTNSWFGTGGMSSIANVLAYDTRRTGFSGWGGGVTSLGGPAIASGNTNPANFQPSVPVDRVSIFYAQRTGEGTFTVAKGSETTTINAQNATSAIIRAEITFTTKDANPIVITRTTGGYIDVIGMVAWDSATPGIEVSNFATYGVVSGYQADTSTAYAPLNALAVYAPDITFINLGTNDLNQSVTLATYTANIQAIVTVAKATGDCVLEWPSIGGTSPAYGADATRSQWKAALQALALANGCGYIDHETLLGGRTSGATADGVHELAWAYDAEAQAEVKYLLQ